MVKIPKLEISLGDPGGIGPEVALKALNSIDRAIRVALHGPESLKQQPLIEDLLKKIAQNPYLSELTWQYSDPCEIVPGIDTKAHGLASFTAVQNASQNCQNEPSRALVTAPISKHAWSLAGIPYQGHTDYFQSISKAPLSMAFHSPHFNVVLHSIHIALAKVPATIRPDTLKVTLDNAVQFGRLLGISKPKIAIAGLNPHAGENGLMGDEERGVIEPFVRDHQSDQFEFVGPFSPDTLFRMTQSHGIDIIIALYHDQGLIPLKLLDFDSAVNITIGLAFFRSSPDHGTAYDIAYQNIANPASMKEAIKAAIRYCDTHDSQVHP